ncbi:MAG: hypothetical protein PF692_14880 [Kiritimatiellae bacterium]|jgi:hypothetical protein|nr:hypothetical protein [Kiritimatiellia bacterium]
MNERITVFMAICWAILGVNLFGETINQTDTPLFRVEGDQPFAFCLKAEIGSRDLEHNDVYVSMDKTRYTAELAVDVLPFMGLFAEAGVAQATLDNRNNDDGSYGFTWGLGADFNLLEFLISESPVIGKKQWLQLRVRAKVESNESNMPGADFSWYEYKVIPSIIYNNNLKTKVNINPTQPMAVATEIGLIFSQIDGKTEPFDEEQIDFSEADNIGVLLGVAFLGKNDWICRVNGELYGSGGGSAIFSIGYNF